jgi:SH3-like domain-containing protein
MIHTHLYARNSGTKVFGHFVDTGIPVFMLEKGSWVGVIERHENWIKVISIDGEGWVRAEELENRPPFQLHVCWSSNGPKAYVNTIGGEHQEYIGEFNPITGIG